MILRRLALLLIAASVSITQASDWSRFRGPNGSGVNSDSVVPPVTWSENQNLKWKVDLPGPGLSSPIVIGDRIVLTCWKGYAAGGDDQGSMEDLERSIVCLNRNTCETIWEHSEKALLPEDSYRGMFAENGYASHTPATDGQRVYAFLGKSGVIAVSLTDGKKLWQKSVGENREGKGWGSASSPIVYQDKVIVPAFIEGDAIVAIDGATGEIAWKQETPGYRSNWSTPVLVEANDRVDLVMAVPGEVWGLNPDSGKLRWYCEVPGSDSARASVTAVGDVVVAMAGGRGSNTSVAVRAGGKGETKPIWEGRDVSSTGTPVIYGSRLYLVKSNVVVAVDMENGKRLSQTRLTAGETQNDSGSSAAGAEADERPASGNGRSGGSGGSYGGGRGGQDYSSPVVAGDKLYYTARAGDLYVVQLADQPKQVAVNRFEGNGEYNATPAISNGELFIRSSKTLYCVAAKTE